MNVRLLQVALVTAAIGFLSGCQRGELSTPPKGPHVTACYSSGNPKFCSTSFARLMANPGSAEGRTVALVGYLGVRRGLPMLYPNESDYTYGIISNAIYVRGSDLSMLDGFWYKTVTISGEFHVTGIDGKGATPWLGSITAPTSIHATLPLDREDTTDLLIDIDLPDAKAPTR